MVRFVVLYLGMNEIDRSWYQIFRNMVQDKKDKGLSKSEALSELLDNGLDPETIVEIEDIADEIYSKTI